jgi:7-carboxy-7-deazaguanine synthase
MTTLRVNELYGPVQQGEGPALGEPCLFLRMANCNLKCDWCDTKYSHDWSIYDRSAEEHFWTKEDVAARLRALSVQSGVKLVILSGGEPCLQSIALSELMRDLPEIEFDIETAGTLWPGDAFVKRLRTAVVSPKLFNSGNIDRRSIRLDVLREFMKWPHVYFKFVVKDELDVVDVTDLLSVLPHPRTKRIYLMPMGATQEQLRETSPHVQRLAERYGFSYTPRRHIELYGAQRGR